MTSIKNFSKRAIESIAGGSVWLEHPSDIDQVQSLIERLRPTAIDKPLIRVGGEADGGYLIPDDLDGISAAVSPGVSDTIDFDSWFAQRGVDVFMVDASVDGPPADDPKFHFQKKFLDVFEDEENMRLDTLASQVAAQAPGDRILQMDIEGAELRVLLDASDETLKSFRIMLVEFHQLDRLFAKVSFDAIKATFEKLLRFHEVVHIHPNNVLQPIVRGDLAIPPAMEFTFYRKDRVKLGDRGTLTFPHPLDQDNVGQLRPVVLPMCWR